MRIEASSWTSPFSRRSAMVSSSFSACSKAMGLISESGGSAMIWLSPFLHLRSRGGTHQRGHVHRSGACQGIEVVAALERGDEVAARIVGGRLQELLGVLGTARVHD